MTEPITVIPFQLLQWKRWLLMEERMGHAVRHSRGSVKAHAARTFGLSARAPRAKVLEHVEAALAACKAADVPMLARAEIS